jgi:hypothetical protein
MCDDCRCTAGVLTTSTASIGYHCWWQRRTCVPHAPDGSGEHLERERLSTHPDIIPGAHCKAPLPPPMHMYKQGERTFNRSIMAIVCVFAAFSETRRDTRPYLAQHRWDFILCELSKACSRRLPLAANHLIAINKRHRNRTCYHAPKAIPYISIYID